MIVADRILDTQRVTAALLVCSLNPEGNKVAIMSLVTAVAIVTKILDQSAGDY